MRKRIKLQILVYHSQTHNRYKFSIPSDFLSFTLTLTTQDQQLERFATVKQFNKVNNRTNR